MKTTTGARDISPDPAPPGGRGVQTIFAVFLIMLGAAWLFAGIHGIRQQVCEVTWQEDGNMAGITVQEAHGVLRYEGADAVRFGVGLVAGGSMFVILATCLLRRLYGHPRTAAICLGWVSLLCLLITCVTFFPPWQIASVSFYAVGLVFGVSVFSLLKASQPRWWEQWRVIIPLLIISAMIAGFSGLRAVAVGVTLGLFAWLAVIVHLAMLIPRISKLLVDPLMKAASNASDTTSEPAPGADPEMHQD
jgi:hypothetical protein